MWMTSRRQSFASRIRSFDQGGVLDEHTFWQIVKTERERADRSGMPVTIAVFTVREDRQRPEVAAWNAATLCSSLRATIMAASLPEGSLPCCWQKIRTSGFSARL